MIEHKPVLTIEFIRSFVTQESIYETLIGIKVQTTKKFLSPFRSDKNPTCTLAYRSGVLLFRDWTEEKSLDDIACVKRKYNCDFNSALNLVYETFKSAFKTPEAESFDRLKARLEAGSRPTEKTRKANLQIAIKEFSKEDLLYFNQFGITKPTLEKFLVYPVKKAWRNNYVIYQYNPLDPCIAYYFGKDEENKDKLKLYFYKRKVDRFITNTNRIQGIKQIPNSGELLIITKSLKDIMCLYELGIPSIAPQSESFIFYDYIIEELKKRYKTIILLFDNDITGLKNATKHAELYGIRCVFYPENTQKDTSDFYKAYGREETLIQIQKLIYG